MTRQAARNRLPAASLVWAAEADLIGRFQSARSQANPAAVEAAASLLVRANTSLVRRAVPRRRSTGRVDGAELEQAATVGLLDAAGRFRPVPGVAFSAYAHHWIRKEVQRALAAGSHALAVPANQAALVRVVAAKLADDPNLDDEQLGSELRTTPATAGSLRTAATTVPLEEHDPLTDDGTDGTVDRLAVRAAVALLDPSLQATVRLRHGLDGGPSRSYREIGRILGMSDFTVRARVRKAHRLLRRLLA